ncbi:outer membrane protein assembly factor BamD [Paraliomyxa miuraensis]|uniref:outer membrane protein assembly factor BamD n=1 Tax=Paraliomyxa miuraensis TaxID=376150 RepID=UPI002259A4E0|nr:outer membrane protein assembly factor BamD [Paraliomyxa miuraensis]MCX4242164.1 outer membrane protein assembly factor BamD [Paraliomyxa miuraensis]
MRLGLALALGLASGLATACKSGPDLSADYAQTARENYELALGEFSDEDWDETIQYADFVRIRFPFSRFAVEAELLIARAEFEQGNYLTAQDAFAQFAKLHPTHKHVRNGWVSYMAAVSAYMNGPQSFFLLPPDYQRDQSRLREALLELDYFFDHYGDTPTAENALLLRDEINRRLLAHELYVARFYLDRNKPEAAIGRLESAHAQYPGIGLDAEVLFLLGVTYLRMEEVELSRSTFSELQSQHPTHHHGKQARIYLRYIYDTYGPADPSRKRPDRSPPVPVPPPKPKNRERPERPELAAEPGPAPETTPAKLPPRLPTPPAGATKKVEGTSEAESTKSAPATGEQSEEPATNEEAEPESEESEPEESEDEGSEATNTAASP